MKTLRNEIPKTLPYAALFGVIGGVLLITVNNVFDPSPMFNLLIYMVTGGAAVIYVLKKYQKREVKSTLYLTTKLFTLMTFIAFLDFMMNANKNFQNPLFDNAILLPIFLALVMFLGTFITLSLRKG